MTLAAAGAKNVEIPDLETVLHDFDAALTAAPVLVDRERQELMAALGVG